MSTAAPARTGLRRAVGLTGVVMLGAGTAIGVSIFSVLQPAAEVAGPALLTALAFAIVPMIFFAIIYAWLASVLPVSGASYEWPRRFLGPYIGFSIAWLRIISNVGALVVLGRVFANYVGMVTDIPPELFAPALLTLVFTLNYLGAQIAAKAQTLLMVGLILVLGFYVGTGVPHFSRALAGDPLAGFPLTALAAVPLMISLFLGIESAVEIGEEVRNPERNIPLGILLAILLTAVVYGAVALVTLGLIGPDALARAKAPLVEAGESRTRRCRRPTDRRGGRAFHHQDDEFDRASLLAQHLRHGPQRQPSGTARRHPSPFRHAAPRRADLLCPGHGRPVPALQPRIPATGGQPADNAQISRLLALCDQDRWA